MSGKGRRAHHDERALMYVGTKKGIFIYESDFDREKWKRTGPFVAEHVISSIAYDFRDKKSVLVASLGGGLRRTRDNGRTWEQIGRDLPSERVSLVTIGHLAEPTVLWAGLEPAGLAVSRDGGASFTDVASFRALNTGAQGVSSIVVHSDSPKRLHVAVHGGAIFRTEDGGATWTNSSEGFSDVTRVVSNPAKPERLYAAAATGIFRTDDDGQTWVAISNGLPSKLSRSLVVSPSKPGTLFVVPLKAGSGDPPTVEGGLSMFRSTDGGDSWERRSEGLPENLHTSVHPEALAMDTLDEEGLYLATTSGAIFVTRDEGETWTQIASGLAPIVALEVITEQE